MASIRQTSAPTQHAAFATLPSSAFGLAPDASGPAAGSLPSSSDKQLQDAQLGAEQWPEASSGSGSGSDLGSVSDNSDDEEEDLVSGSASDAASEAETASDQELDLLATSTSVASALNLRQVSPPNSELTAEAALAESTQAESGLEALADRCLRPLDKLQQPNFLGPIGGTATGMHSQSDRQPSLVWQNSGWTVPFDPARVQRSGQNVSPKNSLGSKGQLFKTLSSSWHAQSLDDLLMSTASTAGTAGTSGSKLNIDVSKAGTADAAGSSSNVDSSTAGSAVGTSADNAAPKHAASRARHATAGILAGAQQLPGAGWQPSGLQQPQHSQHSMQHHSGQDADFAGLCRTQEMTLSSTRGSKHSRRMLTRKVCHMALQT